MSILYAVGGGGGGGYYMLPDTDTIADPTEIDIINGMPSGVDANKNQDVMSLWGIQTWSNQCLEKRIIIKNETGETPNIGTTGIGTWQKNPSLATLAQEQSWGWYHDAALELDDKLIEWGCTQDDIDIDFLFDPSSTKIPIVLGGYILDTTTGYICIKFATEYKSSDIENLKIAIDIKVTRTNVG